MKFKRKFLTIISSCFGVLALCGFSVFSLLDHKKDNNVQSVSAMPSSTFPGGDINDYYGLFNFEARFHFSWDYVTTNSYLQPGRSFISNKSSPLRKVTRAYNDTNWRGLTTKPEHIYTGLVWVGDERIIDYGRFDHTYDNEYLRVGIWTFTQNIGASKQLYLQTAFNQNFIRAKLTENQAQPTYLYADTTHGYADWSYEGKCRVWYFSSIDTYLSSAQETYLIDNLWEAGKFYNLYMFGTYSSDIIALQGNIGNLHQQISGLNSDIADLNGQLESLESDYESQISDLNDEIDSLETEISDLEAELEDAYDNSVQGICCVSVDSIYTLTCDIFVNITDTSVFFVKPKSYDIVTDINIKYPSGESVDSSHSIVDSLDLTSYPYYYSSGDLANYLFIDAEVGTDNLLVNFYAVQPDRQMLINANAFLRNYRHLYTYDLSFYGGDDFYEDFVYYKNQILAFNDLTNTDMVNGYDVGYIDGYNNGNLDGYSLGRSDGFEEGIEANGTVVTIFSGILQVAMVPVNFFLSIFNFEILGINLSGFIQALFTIAITIIVIKTVFGKGGE